MIAHSRTMSSSFAVQFALAIGVFYELGFGLVNLSPMAAFGLAVLPFAAVVVAPAFLMGGGRRAHDGKYLYSVWPLMVHNQSCIIDGA